jgi:hypothetical protein
MRRSRDPEKVWGESVDVDRTDCCGENLGFKFEQQKYVKWRTGVCAHREF